MTAPAAAGPGFPRAPPSTCTTSFNAGSARVDVERRRVARDAGAAPVALHPLLLLGLRCLAASPPITAATIDDHLDVVVACVVGRQLVKQLVGQIGGDHAVDHVGADANRSSPCSSAVAFGCGRAAPSSAGSSPRSASATASPSRARSPSQRHQP